jgi:NADPH:quinone reductase-like Zn-dependent oxidoreductase
MRALLQERYGPPGEVLELREVEAPSPAEGQVLVRVRAASVNPADWHLIRGEPLLIHLVAGLRAPRDPRVGGDCAGVVEAVGRGVSTLAVGDEVFGTALGSFAELAVAKVDRLGRKPAHLSFEQAATIPVAGCTALQALRDHARLEAGQHVLVLGAAGGVGSFAVQIAKAQGAHVTGVCGTENVEFVRGLGADEVVDYTRDEPAGAYDVVLQIAGDRPLGELRRLLTPRGTLVVVGGGVGRSRGGGGLLLRLAKAKLGSRKNGKRMATFIAKIRTADLETVAGLVTPHVERVYPLAEVADALAVIEGGHVRGKLAIAVPSASAPQA